MSLEKFGFTNFKESVPPEKEAKIDKKLYDIDFNKSCIY
jgi:hypothetical protein